MGSFPPDRTIIVGFAEANAGRRAPAHRCVDRAQAPARRRLGSLSPGRCPHPEAAAGAEAFTLRAAPDPYRAGERHGAR